MPIYEYACSSCNHELETWQGIKDAPLTRCPRCSAEALQRLISRNSFALKGSGWYVTDYKRSTASADHGK